ncbi:MAG: matrixin family metalloprotease [Betaproteobacteria bacterium]
MCKFIERRDSKGRGLAAATMLATAVWCGGAAGAEVPDFALNMVPNSGPVQPSGHAVSKYKYTFGAPARWQGPLHWRYNHANAPSSFSSSKDAVVAQLIADSSKWTAACGVQIVYDGETSVAPNNLGGGADGFNVIGWGKPDIGISGATYSWYQSNGANGLALVDSDMILDPKYVTTLAQMTMTVSHEWGHAIGLAHSNVERTLMSGSPDSAYTNYTELTADDVNGCRCLYGPPPGQQAGNFCSLPDAVEFGSVGVGVTSAESEVTVENSGNGAMQIAGVAIGGSEFAVGTNQCGPGTTLAPGTSCRFGVVARLARIGDRTDEVTISTSEGPFRIPLDASGVAGGQPAPNYEGAWVNTPAGSESGWGLTLSHQGDVIFATWFTYDENGKAWWLSMTANKVSENAFVGTLYETHGSPFNSVPFDSKAVSYSVVGTATLVFNSESDGTISYLVNGIAQVKRIERMAFAKLPVCTFGGNVNATAATNYQDVWWSSAGAGEAGWGTILTHQGDIIFASWYTYDFDGTPLWLSATAIKRATGIYEGTLIRTTGPAFSAVPFDPAKVVRTPVGTLTLTFGDGNHATFAYTVALGTPPVAVTQSKQITRLVYRAPGTVCQ